MSVLLDSPRRKFTARLVLVILGLSFAVLLMEIALRFCPVNDGLHSMPVTAANPILRREPHRAFLWSIGWDFSIVNRAKTNNEGFVSNIEYTTDHPKPLMAVIGDSFIEAAMVPWDETTGARLIKMTGKKGTVYTFGIGGASLGQYLAMADYVEKKFHPDALVINVVDNDFDGSLLKYCPQPGFHYFVEDNAGNLQLMRQDYTPGKFKRLIRRSALFRYFLLDVGILYWWQDRAQGLKTMGDDKTILNNRGLTPDERQRISDSRKSVDTFFRLLHKKAALDKSRIVITIDGLRPALYNPEELKMARGSYFDLMRREMIEKGASAGYTVIDLQPFFIKHFQIYKKRFEFPTDSHWNGTGHEVLAQTIAQSKLFHETFQGLQ